MRPPPMIEVYEEDGRWHWTMISAGGRTIVYSVVSYDTDVEADRAAKEFRNGFFQRANELDEAGYRAV